MWKNVDISKIQIAFKIEDLQVTVLNAKRTVFRESFPSHLHSFHELHYILGGTGALVCEDGVYPLSAGVVYLNGKSVPHEQLTNPADPMIEYSVSFDIQPAGQKRDFAQRLMDMRLWIGEDVNEIGPLFREVEKELESRKIGDIYILRSLFQMIFVKTIRNFNAQSSSGLGISTRDRRRFLMDEAFIYNYRDMTLESLAKALNISQRHAIRNIREYYGMTFTQFRSQSRLSAAARMLAENRLTVSEIAEAVGFSSTAYFRKLFTQVYALSPSEYRARQNRSLPPNPQN